MREAILAMARFEHLEFGPDPAEPKPPKAAGPSKAAAAPARVEDERQRCGRPPNSAERDSTKSALRFYSRALEYDRSLVAGWVGQVQMLVQLDEAPEGDLWARKALEMFPGNGELMAARAQALCRIGDTPQAGSLCDGALAAAGRSAYRWQVRGEWMLICRQRLEEHCFSKAQEINGSWLVALESALIYLRYKFPSRAVVQARTATELAPGQYFPWFVARQGRGRAGDEPGGIGELRSLPAALPLAHGCRESQERPERRFVSHGHVAEVAQSFQPQLKSSNEHLGTLDDGAHPEGCPQAEGQRHSPVAGTGSRLSREWRNPLERRRGAAPSTRSNRCWTK